MADRMILQFQDPEPVWAMPAWVAERIRSVLTDSWDLIVLDIPVDSSGDGSVDVDASVLEAVRGARVYMSYGIPAAVLREGGDLEWVHTGTAGVQASLTPAMMSSEVLFTNSAGIHGPPIAESVMGMMLYFSRGLDFVVKAQRERRWSTEPFFSSDTPVLELSSAVVGILGYGGLGREVARRVACLGAEVLALRRQPQSTSDPHARVVHGADGLQRILADSDIVVITLPETPETEGLLGSDELQRMRDGAILINVARGSVIEEDALVAALDSGKIRGAALDVVEEEPLPAESPLWRTENLLISPHVACATRRFWERQADLITENVGRFLDRRPLLNLVNKEAGY